VIAFVGLGILAQPAEAQWGFGVEAVYADDLEFGIGLRGQTPIGAMITEDEESILSDVTLILSGDWYLDPCGVSGVDCSAIEIGANGVIPLEFGEGFAPYAGAGIHAGRIAVGDFDDTEFGLNVLGGARFALSGLTAFGEAQYQLGGFEQLKFVFGIMLGGS
jgi:opacity protein-like surface antigen